MSGSFVVKKSTSDTLTIQAMCRCGFRKDLEVNTTAFMNWRGGELIQNCFPELSIDDRELLISNTCPTCWNKMFPKEEE